LASFEILQLFSNLLELTFHRDHIVRDGSVVRLGSHRVDFAPHFLRQKTQLLADRLPSSERRSRRRDVRPETDDFFGHVEAFGEYRDLLGDTLFIGRYPIEQLPYGNAQAIPLAHGSCRRGPLDSLG
jgi:hypothetical protein